MCHLSVYIVIQGGTTNGADAPLSAPVRIIENLSLKFATYICKAAELSRSQKYSIWPLQMTPVVIELGVIKPISICCLLFVKIKATTPLITCCMHRPIYTDLQGRILPIKNVFRSSRYIDLDVINTVLLHCP